MKQTDSKNVNDNSFGRPYGLLASDSSQSVTQTREQEQKGSSKIHKQFCGISNVIVTTTQMALPGPTPSLKILAQKDLSHFILICKIVVTKPNRQ